MIRFADVIPDAKPKEASPKPEREPPVATSETLKPAKAPRKPKKPT